MQNLLARHGDKYLCGQILSADVKTQERLRSIGPQQKMGEAMKNLGSNSMDRSSHV
jgi:hypothetical protein